MKTVKIKLLCLVFIGLTVLISCEVEGESRFTPEQIAMLELLEENEMVDLADLEMFFQSSSDSNCVYCPTELFCGISKNELMPFLKNYRDSIWSPSSNYFKNRPTLDVAQTMRSLNNNSWRPSYIGEKNPFEKENSFDARFMDIPLVELENYLCFLKNNPFTKDANICRFYYIKYDGTAFEDSYDYKHSLAIVPARVEEIGGTWVTTEEFTGDSSGVQPNTIYAAGFRECIKSPMANHNHLCPPFSVCGNKTMLSEVDQ